MALRFPPPILTVLEQLPYVNCERIENSHSIFTMLKAELWQEARGSELAAEISSKEFGNSLCGAEAGTATL